MNGGGLGVRIFFRAEGPENPDAVGVRIFQPRACQDFPARLGVSLGKYKGRPGGRPAGWPAGRLASWPVAQETCQDFLSAQAASQRCVRIFFPRSRPARSVSGFFSAQPAARGRVRIPFPRSVRGKTIS